MLSPLKLRRYNKIAISIVCQGSKGKTIKGAVPVDESLRGCGGDGAANCCSPAGV